MKPFRHRVRAAIVEVTDGRVNLLRPTPERLAQGDLRTMAVRDRNGQTVTIHRSLSLTEQLAAAGELGDDLVRLLTAANWFAEQAQAARLRGRLVYSQLLVRGGEDGDADQVLAARAALAHAYDAIGIDGFNVLYDALVWDIEPRGPIRKALFRAALHSLAQYLRI